MTVSRRSGGRRTPGLRGSSRTCRRSHHRRSCRRRTTACRRSGRSRTSGPRCSFHSCRRTRRRRRCWFHKTASSCTGPLRSAGPRCTRTGRRTHRPYRRRRARSSGCTRRAPGRTSPHTRRSRSCCSRRTACSGLDRSPARSGEPRSPGQADAKLRSHMTAPSPTSSRPRPPPPAPRVPLVSNEGRATDGRGRIPSGRIVVFVLPVDFRGEPWAERQPVLQSGSAYRAASVTTEPPVALM